ncbi:MAG: radical SAM protein, partial [Acidaminococcaceae bacterium]
MFFDQNDSPVFRPPSEANSFILRVTRGCAHNKCTYCNMYRGVPFMLCTDQEISEQIAQAALYGKERIRRIFLADGDALVLPTEKLLKILAALFATFPKLQRVASYAAPQDILRKSEEELRSL